MPYTEALLESIPKLDDPSHTRLRAIAGRPPDLINPPKGCRFSPRCPYVQDRCLTEPAAAGRGRDAGPQLRLLVPGRLRRLEGDQGTAGRGRRRRDPHGRPRRPRGPGGRGGHARRRPDRRPPAGAATRRERTDGRHGHRAPAPAGGLAAAGGGPGRRVPRRPDRAQGQRGLGHQPRRAARRDARAWWASRAAASRRPAGPSCSCPDRRAGRSASAGRSSRPPAATTCAPCAPTSR